MKGHSKEEDVFSFQNLPSEESEHHQLPDRHPDNGQAHQGSQRPTSIANYRYRIDQLSTNQAARERIPFKLIDLDKELQNNARRRLELERKVMAERIIQREICFSDKMVQACNQPTLELQSRKFVELQLERARKTDLLQPHESRGVSFDLRPKPKSSPLDPAEVLAISRRLTFPQRPPNSVIQASLKRLKRLREQHSHSDLLFLSMVACFHQQEYQQTMLLFQELMRFKVFDPKAYWVAAETCFLTADHEKCMKLSHLAMSGLPSSLFPRLLYLRARSSSLACFYSEATVLYNQLIKLCPHVAEYRLQRATLFEKTGQYDFARSDFREYTTLQPQWKDQLREQILLARQPAAREHLISCMASLKEHC